MLSATFRGVRVNILPPMFFFSCCSCDNAALLISSPHRRQRVPLFAGRKVVTLVYVCYPFLEHVPNQKLVEKEWSAFVHMV